jgi:hypothetical protein
MSWRDWVLGGDQLWGTPERRWDFIGWRYSLLLVVGLLGIAGTIAYTSSPDGRLQGVVLDTYSGKPVEGATITTDTRHAVSNAKGKFRIDPGSSSSINIEKPEYDSSQATISPTQQTIEIRLRPSTVRGKIVARKTHKPLSGVTVEAKSAGETPASTKTDNHGAFVLTPVPEGASLVISHDGYATKTIAPGEQTALDFSLRSDVITGVVTDEQGKPVPGATIAAGDARATSAADGTYRLTGIPDAGSVSIKSPGYRASLTPIADNTRVDAKLERFNAKAIYATAATAGRPDLLNPLIDLIDRTELNAIVVDLKDSTGDVFYDTNVQLAHDIGAVHPAFEVKPLLDLLHQHKIYVIARIVVFEDPVLAEARPDWAIHDTATGDLWRTWNGLAWVNAHRPEIWDYDVALAREAARLGFDEIQLDYIRFPSDGPLNRAEYGVPHDDRTRPGAIRDFLTRAHDALQPTGAYLSGDVFGLAMWDTEDSGIGQHLEDVIGAVDFVCPMVYPSHFSNGSQGFDIPNNHPYEVILTSMQEGAKRVPHDTAKIRPWLQDFTLGDGIAYGDAEVQKQIKASDDAGTGGWMLWNAANVYHDGALRPQ